MEVSGKSGAGDKQKTGFIFGSIKRALSSSSGGNNDPASDKPEPLEGVPSPFQTAIQHDSGVLGNHYRRAVYGMAVCTGRVMSRGVSDIARQDCAVAACRSPATS